MKLWPSSRLKVIVTLALSVLLFVVVCLVAWKVREALLLQGRVQGRAEVRGALLLQGRAEEARAILLLRGTEKFGAPSHDVQEAIKRIDDLAKLEGMGGRLGKVSSWKALLLPAVPALGASTVGLLGSPLGQGPLLAAYALIPGRTLLPQ